MIIAPDVFATDEGGTYTPDVATDWIAAHGTPGPLHVGRTLRYTPGSGWEYGPASAEAKRVWKPLSSAPKSLRAAIGGTDDIAAMATGFEPERTDYYELVGPKIAGNPHGRDEHAIIRHGLVTGAEADDFTGVATTSLWALVRNWFPRHPYQGLLWRWDKDDEEPRFAAVRRDRLPRLD